MEGSPLTNATTLKPGERVGRYGRARGKVRRDRHGLGRAVNLCLMRREGEPA